jgi:predicted MFS family arabinose efflux permease
MGIGMSAGLYEAAFSTLARIYGIHARSAITGITLIAGFASTVCWPLTAWMSSTLGWREACWIWAGVHLLVCLPINMTLPRTSAAPATKMAAEGTAPQRGMRLTMAALSFVFGATWFCSTSMAAHLPRLLEMTGITQAAAIAAAALVGPSQVAARFVESMLMRKIGPLTSARLASLAHPVGAGTLIAFGAPATTFFTIVHGAGNGVMTIANGTLPLHLFGAVGYGLRQGLLMAPARVVQAAAPFLFDLALQRYGVGALFFTMGLGLSSTLVLASLRSRDSSR